ncbi:nicotinamidase [Alkalilimnicola ehrlichii]|uniref:nicotinamidase n=1 Tax=Alkalilimnicola ehrlichii TaxID=351052 RepID=A0A3E0WS80_9GAMM|nr:isochorismatase family protein [Alkalilimnicola ehrlichii]RFA28227.1 nicotinamidase [Alkalilimnicola ehrlichii]RFA34827.1 nicotinamidase [Alkalilimnicola ehrlichii]
MTKLPPKDVVASLDVDAQKCFTPVCPDELPVPEGDEIVDELNAQAGLARLRLFSKDAHPATPVWLADAEHPPLSPVEGEANADLYWPLHAVPGTRGFELLDGLPAETAYDHPIYKGVAPDMHPYGAAYHDLAERISTGLIEYLTVNRISHVIVGGLALEFCVATTVRQLQEAGFQVILNLAATRPLDREAGERAVQSMREQGVWVVRNAAELQAEVEA